MLAFVWYASVGVLLLLSVFIALRPDITIGPVGMSAMGFGIICLYGLADGDVPNGAVVAITACAAVGGVDLLWRWRRARRRP